jgi:hypothetical protein
MELWIDAQFVDGRPHLQVVDLETGRVKIDWGLVWTRELLESDRIPAESFLRPERHGMRLLVRNLFLPGCAYAPADGPEREKVSRRLPLSPGYAARIAGRSALNTA